MGAQTEPENSSGNDQQAMLGGWFKLYRKQVQDTDMLRNHDLLAVWMYCFTHASYNEYTYSDGNQVAPGELITSHQKIAAATSLTLKRVRTNLDRLRRMGWIGKTGLPGRHSLITFLNWDLEQGVGSERAEDGQKSGTKSGNKSGTSDGQKSGNNQEVKNTHTKKEEREGAAHSGEVISLSREIVEYLNEKTGQKIPTTAQSHLPLIEKLIESGYGLDDMKTVVDRQVQLWLTDPTMVQHLVPRTLFKLEKFESYLGARSDAGRGDSWDEFLAQGEEEQKEKERRRQFDLENGVPWYRSISEIKREVRHIVIHDEDAGLEKLKRLIDSGIPTEAISPFICHQARKLEGSDGYWESMQPPKLFSDIPSVHSWWEEEQVRRASASAEAEKERLRREKELEDKRALGIPTSGPGAVLEAVKQVSAACSFPDDDQLPY